MAIHQQMLVFSIPLPICDYLLSREGVFPSLQKPFDNLPFRKSIEELAFDQSFSPALVRGGGLPIVPNASSSPDPLPWDPLRRIR